MSIKTLPVKLNTVEVGHVTVSDLGGIEIVLDRDEDYVEQLMKKIQDDECAGLAILPVRNPSPPRPEFNAI